MLGPIIVTALRLIIPLTILRWPLAGGMAAMIIDALDVVLITYLNLGDFQSYHTTDKMLDIYYLSLEGYMSFFWMNAKARNTSLFLFIYRVIGFLLFEVTRLRIFLFIFPNLFENFYLFYLAMQKITKKDYMKSWKNIAIALLMLLIPKMGQEYLLHFAEAKPWQWIQRNVL